VLLVFFLIYGFSGIDFSNSKDSKDGLNSKVKTAIGILALLFVVVLILVLTPLGEMILGWFNSYSSDWGPTIVFIIVIIAAIAVAVAPGKSSDKDDDKDE
jgi:hypothetical protein